MINCAIIELFAEAVLHSLRQKRVLSECCSPAPPHGLCFVFAALFLLLQQIPVVHIGSNTIADASQIGHMIGKLLDRVDLLLQEVRFEKIAKVLVFVATGYGVDLEQALAWFGNECFWLWLLDCISWIYILAHLINLSLQLQCRLHRLLGCAPFGSGRSLNVLQHHTTASFVLILEEDHGVFSLVTGRSLEVGMHARQGYIVTVEVVGLWDSNIIIIVF